ncbi:M20 family peptidase [Ferrovibrio sp.]|uniref:M20 family peptidase n=1 Tax=Ferrovibrio sp. TaxID=1917215 RepID=UPI0035136DA1
MIRKLLLALLAVIVVVAGIVVYRAITFVPAETTAVQPADYPIDADAVAGRLSEAVRFQTISRQPPEPADPVPFAAYIAWLETAYPDLHAALKRERLGSHALLYTWPGRDPAAKPVMLTAHYDVVPVIPGTEGKWTHPPFAGVIADGHVWGRGTLDDKGAMITMLEAVSHLLREGFVPKQTVYLAFGDDEEVGGERGAGAIVAHLQAQKVRLDWSLDEGSFVLDGIVPGVARPLASINIAEKGYLTLQLTAQAAGGHSSMPPRETAVGLIAEAIVRLQRAPLPGGLDGVSGQAFGAMARNMSFDKRILFANQWLFGGLLDHVLSQAPTTNAMLRTTTAPTMLSGSVKENVLPIEATGTVNFRLHPRDTVDGVIAYVKQTIADERITVSVVGRASEPSAVAGTATAGFRAMAAAVRRSYGDAVVLPGLTIAATDSAHYGAISDNAYRFNPMMITAQDLTGFHGTNERLSLENLARATAFYIDLLKTTGG